MSTLDEGYCALVLKDGEGSFRMPRTDYDRIRARWMEGETFLDVVSIDGVRATIKLALVLLVEDLSAEALSTWRARQKEAAAQEILEGT